MQKHCLGLNLGFTVGSASTRFAVALFCLLAAWSADAQQTMPTEEACPFTGTAQMQTAPQSSEANAVLPTMPANEILAILQQDVASLTDYKNIAGQRYGVDPSTITDERIYGCIRVDPVLRGQISAALRDQGYQSNPAWMNSADRSAQGQPSSLSDPARQGDQPRLAGPGSELDQQRYADQQQYPDQQRYTDQQRQTDPARQTNLQRPSEQQRINEPPRLNEPIRPVEQPRDEKIRKPNPYPNIPSLVDLYSQDLALGRNLKRFGSDAFRFGTGNASELPIDLPVGPDYVLGPGDNLIVNMWGSQSQRLERTIDRQGKIALPEAGTVGVAGLTMTQAQIVIQHALGTQFQSERVDLSLGRVRSVRVYVVGDVQRPGGYDVSSLSTPLNALYSAGGPTSRGSMRTLRQMRGDRLVRDIDLYEFLLSGVRSDLERLLPGDTILIPPAGPLVTIKGMVQRPAIYELRGEHSLDEALKLAGGLLVTASMEIRVERVVAHEKRTMLNVAATGDRHEADAKLAAFKVQDGDQITVSPILPYNSQSVYLDGHVFKPGAYAWHEGMTIADLLGSYQDILPEPASHAEIIRLQPPDFRPQTISFDLSEAMIGNNLAALQPFDVIRVFGRYDIDPPKVSIQGEVLRPGLYPMSQGMTFADLVRMAGGFRRSAYREEAELTSYELQDGRKVTTNHRTVAIGKVLDGDKSADVTLKPGDIVGIHKLTGWQDIGASITVSGEVAYSGTYGIREGERLSSVLRRAGGFTAQAYPQGAVLERVQVRTLEENNRQTMIQRIQSAIPTASAGVSSSTQDQQNLIQSMRQQQQDVLAALRSRPSTGRLVIRISSDLDHWENTQTDIELRAGDTLSIPKRPEFVLISGQVYNNTGITYTPGKTARWYLERAGGVTRYGDKKAIFIVRADGSVAGKEKNFLLHENTMDVRLRPGDSIIVPEKVLGGSQFWRNLIASAQVMSSVALTGAVSGAF